MSASTTPRPDVERELGSLRALVSASAAQLRGVAGYLVDRYAAGAEEETEIRAVIEDVARLLDTASACSSGGGC